MSTKDGSRHHAALTTRGSCLLAAGAVLVASGLWLGLGDLVRLGLVLVALPLLALVAALAPRRGLTVTREAVPARLVVGEEGEVRVRLTSDRRLPTAPLAVHERVDYALADPPRLTVPPVGRDRAGAVDYRVRAAVRGEHRLGPLTVRSRDPLGLAHRRTVLGGADRLLVVPQVVPLGAASPRGGGSGDDEDVADTVALRGEDDVTIRPYRQGDELRRIHWPASAHTGALMVRQEEQPTRRRAAVVVDRRRHAHRSPASLETAVVAGASVVAHLLAVGYDVDLLVDGDRALPLAPSRGTRERGLDAALDVLARLVPAEDDALAHALHLTGSEPRTLVVAVLGTGLAVPHEVEDARRPGTTAVALVVDAPGGRRDADRPARESSVLAALRSDGWRTGVAHGPTDLPRAWAEATGTGGRGRP